MQLRRLSTAAWQALTGRVSNNDEDDEDELMPEVEPEVELNDEHRLHDIEQHYQREP
jgi:hypothetical protein